MHVAIISDQENTGGAAIAATRLAHALVKEGVNVTRILGKPDNGDEASPWNKILLKKPVITLGLDKLYKKISGINSEVLFRQYTVKPLKIALEQVNPDIINIHNIHGAAWFPEFVELCEHYAPVFWTLHDMWSFTGTCAYAYGCDEFLSGCTEHCPVAHEYPSMHPKFISRSWERKRELFRNSPELTGISPSTWLAREAQRGLWRDHTVVVIPNGLPLDLYRPIDIQTARRSLGIRSDYPVLLSSASDITERRKGGKILKEALDFIHTEITVVTFGKEKTDLSTEFVHHINLGYVSEQKKILAYNSADLFIHPAPADNLPNVVMESIACGTPVVAFKTGGIPDMVRPGITGWLSDRITAESLAETIEHTLLDRRFAALRPLCRTIAENEYDVRMQAGKYIGLFNSQVK